MCENPDITWPMLCRNHRRRLPILFYDIMFICLQTTTQHDFRNFRMPRSWTYGLSSPIVFDKSRRNHLLHSGAQYWFPPRSLYLDYRLDVLSLGSWGSVRETPEEQGHMP